MVEGGGVSGQAQAVRHAVARALTLLEPWAARTLGRLVAWDSRRVERMKPGRAGARAGFTWVKR